MTDALRLALIHDVFTGSDAAARLEERLREARERGADLAVLPELPMQPWCAAEQTAFPADAEPPNGPRHEAMAQAARTVGIGVVGGVIVAEPEGGRRYNTALVFDGRGEVVGQYRKVHLPREPGFWETSHYEPGGEPPRRIDDFAMSLGLQICSDVNRPIGTHVLAAAGVELVIAPRATPVQTYPRWRLVLRANAMTGACYVVSVNRPAPEAGVPLGGPSVAIAPTGQVIAESTDPVHVVQMSRGAVAHARRDYPGYLPWMPGMYARAWQGVADGASS